MSMQKRPNILWIMTDQQKAETLSCTWANREQFSYMYTGKQLTPNLDTLANEGVLFMNAYSPSPTCAPARSCMKTGKYPAAHGVTKNWVPFRKDQRFLPELLRENGYDTGMVGKLHFFPPECDYGFEEKHLSDAPYSVYADDDKHSEYIQWLRKEYFDAKGIDPVKIFDEDESSYNTDLKRFCMGSCFRNKEEHETVWTTDLTLDFLRKWDHKKPFFYYTSYFGPHQPYGAPKPYDSFCSPENIRLPKNFSSDLKRNAPVFEKTARGLHNHIRKNLTEADCKELIAAYLGQIHMIDEEIGRTISCLKEEGLYDDTVIIFTSDHGDHLGEHGLFFKSQMYDSCTKVPLIIKPQNSRKGFRRDEVVNSIDLFQTILEIAGIEEKMSEKDEIESRSLIPLLSEGEKKWDNSTFSISGSNRERLSCMIREGNWKLLRAGGGKEKAVYELYHLKEDPKEDRDLYQNPLYEDIRTELQNKLEQWFQIQYERMEG